MLVKNLRALWTEEGKKKYSFTLRLWLTLTMLLHFCALIAALAILMGLSLLAAPLVTVLVNVTSLIKNLASLLLNIYHEIKIQRKLSKLNYKLGNLNFNFNQNLAFFEEMKQKVRRISFIETKINEYKTTLNEIENIQEPALLDNFILKIKKQAYEAIELDDLIVLHLQKIEDKKEKLIELITNLSTEIEQLKQDNKQKQDSISMLKRLPRSIADLNSEMDNLQKEVNTANAYSYKLQALVSHFKNIKSDIDILESLKSLQAYNESEYLNSQIKMLEIKIKNALEPVSHIKANRFFIKIFNSINEDQTKRDFTKEKSDLIALLIEETAILSKDLAKLNLEIKDKWNQRLSVGNENNIKVAFSEIYNKMKKMVRLKKQKDITEMERRDGLRNIFLGVLLTANAILLYVTLHWLLSGILTATMITLTVISVFSDIAFFFSKKDAVNYVDKKEQWELSRLRQHKLEELEKMIDVPILESKLQEKLDITFKHLDTPEDNDYTMYEYFTPLDRARQSQVKNGKSSETKRASLAFRNNLA